jgi:hypothetical protein
MPMHFPASIKSPLSALTVKPQTQLDRLIQSLLNRISIDVNDEQYQKTIEPTQHDDIIHFYSC